LRSLVLFDIDGTLVRKAGPQHRQALEDAMRAVTGGEVSTQGIPVHGMLDPDIITLTLQAVGFEPGRIAELMPRIIESAQDVYDAIVPADLTDKQCPGVSDLLEHLRATDTALALVTGNLTRIGWRKLQRAGLDHYFLFGAFGEMAPTRGGLARLAIARARAGGLIDPDASIALIGDAPQDVIAANENGIRCIAVRTGITAPGDLEACNPFCVLDDLTGLDRSII